MIENSEKIGKRKEKGRNRRQETEKMTQER